MEYKRLKNQLRIHWHWIRNNEDFEEVYKILKIWIDSDIKKSNRKSNKFETENKWITHDFNPLLDLVEAMKYLKTKKEK